MLGKVLWFLVRGIAFFTLWTWLNTKYQIIFEDFLFVLLSVVCIDQIDDRVKTITKSSEKG